MPPHEGTSVDFPELRRVEALGRVAPELIKLRILTMVTSRDRSFPVYGVTIGAEEPERPTFGLFAGVHGLERIGTHIALAYLEGLAGRLRWDKELRRTLRKARVVSIPVVNPAGIYQRRRANPRGVDLMRNAPVEAERRPPRLIGGHRFSKHLPWYRGEGSLEVEAKALVDFVELEMFRARTSLALDVHSGFGMRDRLWYPYAKARRPISKIDAVLAFANLLDQTHPHHVYLVEPQSASYTTHGDLWDHLFDRFEATAEGDQLFLPFTLEIGSWRWLKKDPSQILSLSGAFNPSKPHRYSRAMRRHLALLDFFLRATRNGRSWRPHEKPDPTA